MSKCRKIGHDYHIVADDKTKILEKCSECGHKKRHYRGAVAEKHSKQSQEYAQAHKRDVIQPGSENWDVAWKKKHKADQDELVKRRETEAELEQEDFERANHDPLNKKIIY